MSSKQPIQTSSKSYPELWQDLNEQQSEKVLGGGIGTSPRELGNVPHQSSTVALVLLFANPFA
ncbi:MAG: hypothetical protein KME23_16320 [Goleter apudmare HA4340-LM2]|jgi:hypothetical protein|nr:hypothetical protein [Goleter apudmare HA4340-LM2]